MSRDHTFVVDVEATLEVRETTLAPRLIFAFPGLEDPESLWVELRSIGWHVPDRPPHPEPEIDWNGKDRGYAVLPYPVEGFEIEARDWPSDEVAERGLKTVNTLRRMGVDLDVPIAYLDFLRRAQVSVLSDPERQKPVERPTLVPTTLFLSKQPWSSLIDDRNIKVYETATSPNQPNWFWSESELPVDELFTRESEREQVLRTLGLGWELIDRVEVPPAIDGRHRTLRFVVRDLRDGSGMLDLLKEELVGDSSLLMRPIQQTRAVNNCMLVISVVPSHRFSEIGQRLISNFSDAIGRGRSYIPLGRENVA